MTEPVKRWDGELGHRWVSESARYDALNRRFGERIVAAAAPGPGERVLEVGCGTGALALDLARLVGPRGSVLGVDISAAMLDLARTRASEAGLDNVTFETGDAQVYPLPAAAFDLVVSRFGIMFVDDALAAFTNLARATRPGGRLLFATWQEMDRQERKTVPGQAALPHLPGAAWAAPGPAYSLADAGHTTALLEKAGFGGVELRPCEEPQLVSASIDDAAAFLRDTELDDLFTGASEADAAAATRAIADALQAHVTPDGVTLLGRAWLVTATRPA